MDLNVGGIAATTFGVYIFLAPFAYKEARDHGRGRFPSAVFTILCYGLLFLWIAGASSALYGVGLVFGTAGHFEGSGGYSPGEAHWEPPHGAFLLAGLGMMTAGWVTGKALEWFQNRPSKP